MPAEYEPSPFSAPLLRPNPADIDEEASKGGARRSQSSSWSLGEYAKSIVYGGMDAIVTCFSLISSISGGRMNSGDVLVLGFANLVADGISMGFGDYVSSATEKDMALRERKDTVCEATGDASGAAMAAMERALIRRYMDLGMDFQDASAVVGIFSKYRKVVVEETLAARKGASPSEGAEKPWKNGVVTFTAFILFGSFPLLAFIVLMPFTDSDSVKFVGACVLSTVSLGLLGVGKARMAGENCVASAVMTILNGAIAASVAYGVGWALRNWAGLEDQAA